MKKNTYFFSRVKRKVLPMLAAVLLVLVVSSTGAAEDNFLWEVSGPEGDFYLMGSLHYMVEGSYPLNDEVYNRLEESDTLVVEIDIRDINQLEVQELIQEFGILESGRELADILELELYNQVVELAGPHGLEEEQINSLRPWYVGLLLSNFAAHEMDLTAVEGVDYHLLNKASELDIEVKELESMREQYKMFASLGEEEQIAMIRDVFDDLDRGGEHIKELAELWRAGDAEGFYERFFADQDASSAREEYYRVLFDERDQVMKERIKEMLEGEEKLFVVVGAGHVVGDNGLLYLFEEAGYETEQL